MNGETRTAVIERTTGETDIRIELALDGAGTMTGATGVGFFDHMLTLFAKHGGLTLGVQATGDLHVDAHHLVEDMGICLGRAVLEAVGDKRGIARYGMAYVPMDECLARCVLDLSGRPWCVIEAETQRDKVGEFDVELAWEFFRAFANEGRMNLHLDLLRGGNTHHALEACFKATARALRVAVKRESGSDEIPSTKGILT